MNNKKLAANRKNARKSTGPKTPAGKATSSRNAVKHGVLAATPVLPSLESPEAWEDHLTNVVKSLAPVGYIENLLAKRIALIAWRLQRVVRYEVEVTTAAAASAEIDLEAQAEYEKPADPDEYREKAEMTSFMVEMLEALPSMSADERLASGAAANALWAFSEELPEDRDAISIPGVPDDDAEFDRFDDWTAGLLRKSLEVYAAAGRMTPDVLLNAAIQSFKKKCEESKEQEQHLEEQQQRWKLRLNRKIRGLILLEPDVLEKVARYENGLEKSLFRNLHELQRLQAARSGAAVTPPAAVDVDLTVHHEAMS
jgi:hypothetical protein